MKQNPLIAWGKKGTFDPYFHWMNQRIQKGTVSDAIYESLDSAIPVEWIHRSVKKGLLELSKTWTFEQSSYQLNDSNFVMVFNDWMKFATPKVAKEILTNDDDWELLCNRAKALNSHERSAAWLRLHILRYTNDPDNPQWPTILQRCYHLWEYKLPALDVVSDKQLDVFLSRAANQTSDNIRLALAVHCWLQGRINMLEHDIFKPISRDNIYDTIMSKYRECLLLLPKDKNAFTTMDNQLHLLVLIRAQYNKNNDPDDASWLLEFEQSLSNINRPMYDLLPIPEGRLINQQTRNIIRQQWAFIDTCMQQMPAPIEMFNPE